MPVTSYSRTAASNNSAPPNGAPEGMAPSAVNNTMRQLMKDTVDEATFNGCKVLGSVAGTNTVTGSLSPAITAYTAGMFITFTPAATNTGAVTLNINSVGALDVQKANGSAVAALTAGDLVAGVPAFLVLDSGADDWLLVNPQQIASGTYTPTLTNTINVSSSTSQTCHWHRIGRVVQVSGEILVTCTTGNGTLAQMSISLPIASDLTNSNDLGGAGGHWAAPLVVYGNVTTNVAEVEWYATNNNAARMTFTFSYLVQ